MKKVKGVEYLTRQEVADVLGVSSVTVANMVTRGVFSHCRIGSRQMIMRDEVERYCSDIKVVDGSGAVLGQMRRDVEELMDGYLADDERVSYLRRGLFDKVMRMTLCVWSGVLTAREERALRYFVEGVPVVDAAREMGYEVRDFQILLRKVEARIEGCGDGLVGYAAMRDEVERVRKENDVLRSEVALLRSVGAVEWWRVIPLRYCGFSRRVYNCFHSAGVVDSMGVLSMSRDDMMSLRGFGRVGYEEVCGFIKGLGDEVWSAWRRGVYGRVSE